MQLDLLHFSLIGIIVAMFITHNIQRTLINAYRKERKNDTIHIGTFGFSGHHKFVNEICRAVNEEFEDRKRMNFLELHLECHVEGSNTDGMWKFTADKMATRNLREAVDKVLNSK